MLGTLGSGFACADVSLALLLRFSPVPAFESAAFAAGMDAVISLASLFGLDGFDDEHRLW